jgi:hypothetical protein
VEVLLLMIASVTGGWMWMRIWRELQKGADSASEYQRSPLGGLSGLSARLRGTDDNCGGGGEDDYCDKLSLGRRASLAIGVEVLGLDSVVVVGAGGGAHWVCVSVPVVPEVE